MAQVESSRESDVGRLADKVAIITGGTKGIGLTTARLFAEHGAKVAICARTADEVQRVATELRSDGLDVVGFPLDVSDAAGWKEFVRKVIAAFGKIDILVNNAAIMVRKSTLDVTAEEWQAVIGVNLTGVLLGIQAVASHMKDNNGGSIINVGSIGGQFAHFSCAYSASKWGLRGLTKCAALDLAPWSIRVNAIHPSAFETPMADTHPPGHREASNAAIPFGRAGRPIEAAYTLLFLASDEASFISAADLPVDGGLAGAGLPHLRAKVMRALASGALTSI